MINFIVTYETIDGNGEYEREFENKADIQQWLNVQEGLLQWHSITDQAGNEVTL